MCQCVQCRVLPMHTRTQKDERLNPHRMTGGRGGGQERKKEKKKRRKKKNERARHCPHIQTQTHTHPPAELSPGARKGGRVWGDWRSFNRSNYNERKRADARDMPCGRVDVKSGCGRCWALLSVGVIPGGAHVKTSVCHLLLGAPEHHRRHELAHLNHGPTTTGCALCCACVCVCVRVCVYVWCALGIVAGN
jgi:hypothetical protein